MERDAIKPTERRRFQRVLFDAPVNLTLSDSTLNSRLIDISLKGALIKATPDWPLEIGSRLGLRVDLGEADTAVCMQVEIVHAEADQIGCVCIEIDMDSITHLRRLVELNLGDSQLLERDLQALG